MSRPPIVRPVGRPRTRKFRLRENSIAPPCLKTTNPSRARIQTIEENLKKRISRSEKEKYHEIMADAVDSMIHLMGPDYERFIRESAVFCCEQGIQSGCRECRPHPGCGSGAGIPSGECGSHQIFPAISGS